MTTHDVGDIMRVAPIRVTLAVCARVELSAVEGQAFEVERQHATQVTVPVTTGIAIRVSTALFVTDPAVTEIVAVLSEPSAFVLIGK